MVIREYKRSDLTALSQLYYDTIHRINARDYSPEQIEAWAPEVPETSFWQNRFKNRRVFVAEEEGVVTGFAEFEFTGHIDCFYVHHAWQRRGVGALLLERIERDADARRMRRLFADVSLTARPFFEAMGFRVVEPREKLYRGCRFRQFAMEKNLIDRRDG